VAYTLLVDGSEPLSYSGAISSVVHAKWRN